MSAFDYAAETAKQLIDDFGGPVTITKHSKAGGFDSNGDPITPSVELEIGGVITPALKFKSHQIDGSSILKNDSYSYFYATNGELVDVDYTVTLNSISYRIISVENLTSVDGVRVYTKLHLRG